MRLAFDTAWWLIVVAAITVVLLVMISSESDAGTVTFTDMAGNPTNTIPLPPDGRFQFRVVAAAVDPSILATNAVLVTDDTGQMAPGCYSVVSGTEALVTSEVVIAASPVVVLSGVAFHNADCTGSASVPSNPITVDFVPEPVGLLAPLAP